jgi:hypothetical protein
MSSTVWLENDLLFFAITATMRLFNIDAKKWSMDRKPGPTNP